MSEGKTQMGQMGVTRYSNEQAKRITRECIEIALIQLLESKEMGKISISEIVKRAGVSRTAFYAHYATKEDVLKSVLNETISQIDRATVGDPRLESFWESLFIETGKIAKPFRMLLKAGMGDQILAQITESCLDKAAKDERSRYAEILWVGAIYNVLTHWILEGCPNSPKEMAKICVSIAGIQS